MSGRIWPGALCVVRGSQTPGLNGRFVIAEGRCPDENFEVHGFYIIDAPGESWWIRSAVSGDLLPWPDLSLDGRKVLRIPYVERRALYARCLTPILPPPSADTTEDRSPCELESA